MTRFTALIALSSLALATSGFADEPSTRPSARYVVDSQGARADPSIAARDICAFPFITLMRDGTIVGIVWNQPSHGRLPGDVDCWASTDGGVTWSRRGAALAHEPGTMSTRMNKAFGLLPDDRLIAIAGGWTLVDKPNTFGELDIDQQIPPETAVSDDGGFNWTLVAGSFPAKAPTGLQHTAWGLMQAGHDGALRVASYEFDRETKWRTVRIWRSDDGGKSWGDPVMLDPERRMNETSMLHLGDGRWIAVSRESALDLYRSSDDARTWQRVGPVTEASAYPGTLIRLADGRILLSNGNRTKGDERCEVRISTDEGATFSPPVRIVDFIGMDGGYPCSVQRADGRVVTVYYAKETSYHSGYHMGVVIWDPTRTFPPDQD